MSILEESPPSISINEALYSAYHIVVMSGTGFSRKQSERHHTFSVIRGEYKPPAG
jgi:hypothetical protein